MAARDMTNCVPMHMDVLYYNLHEYQQAVDFATGKNLPPFSGEKVLERKVVERSCG
jgi:hypothetical protein